ncbi:hypothetical protein ACIRRA_37380 [Nocardia sp. NPDC101769]|uniref:hypothetical protein n=1 Tax=Nocardia sp. NPDC101769 TaxID=3364333 RepID=UPI0037F7BB77
MTAGDVDAPPTTYLPSIRRILLGAVSSIALVAAGVFPLIEHASLGHNSFKAVFAVRS